MYSKKSLFSKLKASVWALTANSSWQVKMKKKKKKIPIYFSPSNFVRGMVVAPLHTHKPTWLPKKYIPFPHSFQLQTLITQWLNCLLSSDAYGPTLGVIKHTQPWLARPIPINHGKRERLGLGALVSNAELHSPMPALPPHTHHDKQSSIHPRIHDISWWEKREEVGRLLSAYWPKHSALDKDTPSHSCKAPCSSPLKISFQFWKLQTIPTSMKKRTPVTWPYTLKW